MFREDATRRYAPCAESTAGADGTKNTVSATSTWISQAATSGGEPPAPLACEILNEIDDRIDALADQLSDLPDRQAAIVPPNVPQADYLLDQFRILTFTVGGTMNRQIMTDARRIPVGQLRTTHTRFMHLADLLCDSLTCDPRQADRVEEVQRQSQSVSQKMVIVIDRLCGDRASDFLDDLEATLVEIEAIAQRRRSATREDVELLGQRLCEVLAQFEDAVHQTNQYTAVSARFHRVTAHGSLAMEKLLQQPLDASNEAIMRLHIRFGFAVSQFAIRCNNAALPTRIS